MHSRQYWNIVFYTTAILILRPLVYAKPRRVVGEEIHKLSQIHEVPNTQTVYNVPHQVDTPTSFTPRYENHYPTSFQYESPTLPKPSGFAKKQEYQNHQIADRLKLQELQYQAQNFNPENNYILTTSGKKGVFLEDNIAGHWTLAKSEPLQYSKKLKKYKYANTTPRGVTGHQIPGRLDAGQEEPKLKIVSTPETIKNYPHYLPPASISGEKTDIHGPRSTTWKQLGPNVEISTLAEHPIPYPIKADSSYSERSKPLKKRKNVPKNVRTGYMTQQHALYVANNLQNIQSDRGVGGSFDHNNMLKQSDKFDLSDAMFQELELEAKKAKGSQIRIKQESPRYHSGNTAMQYYQAEFPAGTFSNKFYHQPYQANSFNKGFIRNIEIETSPNGEKKSIPALIIPLSPDQLNNPYLTGGFGLYVNQPEILNPGTKTQNIDTVQAFPYEIMNARYTEGDHYNNIVPNTRQYYHYHQTVPIYNLRAAEDVYNPYVVYQQNLKRMPFNLNTPSPTPTNVEGKSTAVPAVEHQNVEIRSTPSNASPSERKERPHPHKTKIMQSSQKNYPQQSDRERSKDYLLGSENQEKYEVPSEHIHYTTASRNKEKDQAEEQWRKN